MSELVHSKSSFFGKVLPTGLLAGLVGFAGWALWSEEAPMSSAQPGASEAASPLAGSGVARDAGTMSSRAPSADDGALGGLTPFAQLVARSAVWDLPAHARVPGVRLPDVQLLLHAGANSWNKRLLLPLKLCENCVFFCVNFSYQPIIFFL